MNKYKILSIFLMTSLLTIFVQSHWILSPDVTKENEIAKEQAIKKAKEKAFDILSHFELSRAEAQTIINSAYGLNDITRLNAAMCAVGNGIVSDQTCLQNLINAAPSGKDVILNAFQKGTTSPATYLVNNLYIGNGSNVQTVTSGSWSTTGGTSTVILNYTMSPSTQPLPPVGAKVQVVFTGPTGASYFNTQAVTVTASTAGTLTVTAPANTGNPTGASVVGTFATYSTYGGVKLECEGVGLMPVSFAGYNNPPCLLKQSSSATGGVITIAGMFQAFEIDRIAIQCTNTSGGTYGILGIAAQFGIVHDNYISGCQTPEAYIGISNGLAAPNNYGAFTLPDSYRIDIQNEYRELPAINNTIGLDVGSTIPYTSSYMINDDKATTYFNSGCPNNQYGVRFNSIDSVNVTKAHYWSRGGCPGFSSNVSSPNLTGCAIYAYNFLPTPSYGPNSSKLLFNDDGGTGVCTTEASNLNTGNNQTITFTGSIAASTGILTLSSVISPAGSAPVFGSVLSGGTITGTPYITGLASGTFGASGSTYYTTWTGAAVSSTVITAVSSSVNGGTNTNYNYFPSYSNNGNDAPRAGDILASTGNGNTTVGNGGGMQNYRTPYRYNPITPYNVEGSVSAGLSVPTTILYNSGTLSGYTGSTTGGGTNPKFILAYSIDCHGTTSSPVTLSINWGDTTGGSQHPPVNPITALNTTSSANPSFTCNNSGNTPLTGVAFINTDNFGTNPGNQITYSLSTVPASDTAYYTVDLIQIAGFN